MTRSQQIPPSMLRRAVRFGFIITYTIVVTVIVLEILLRLFDPIGINYYFEADRYFEAMTPDDDYAYLHTPGYDDDLQGVRVVINSHGLRSPEFDAAKRAGEKRLMILGDSLVFGWGAPQDSIFSAVMRKELARSHSEWSVISAGVGSWNTRTEYEFLRKRGFDYDLDALILVISPNDVKPKSMGRTVVDRDTLETVQRDESPLARSYRKGMRALARMSYAAAAFSHTIKLVSGSASQRLAKLYQVNSPAWRDAEDALNSIVEECRRRNIMFMVFIYAQPVRPHSAASIDAYGSRLEALGVPFELIRRSRDRRLTNSLVDGHPNAAGHRLIAEHILATFEARISK